MLNFIYLTGPAPMSGVGGASFFERGCAIMVIVWLIWLDIPLVLIGYYVGRFFNGPGNSRRP